MTRQVAAALVVAACAAAGCRGEDAAPPAPTFNDGIAQILYTNCASCHRPGGAGPFPLLTYADARDHAEEIADMTLRRQMPPWLPSPGEFPIVGERRLREDQIAAIQRWVTAGAPEGDPARRPAPPVFAEGWEVGVPDLVVSMPRPFVVAPGHEDVYRQLVLRTAVEQPKFVRAVEFQTGGAPIHHAVIRVDRTSASRRRDGEDGPPGFPGMAWQNVQDPDGHFIGWAPGRGPIVAPDGMPWRLDRGADLVVEVHVIPSDAPIPIQPRIGLFFTPTPPLRQPITVKMGSKTIDIPAGARDYVVTDEYRLPVPVELLSVYPHAHYLGREMRVTARLPDGRVRTLLHIPRWSFDWQQDYRYVTPIPLPAGTTIEMRYTYDNSAGNPHNPHTPPARVRAGPESTDEMAELGLQLMPASAEDAAMLVQAFAERELRASIAMLKERAREAPDDGEILAQLGGIYVDAGRFADAVAPLQRALRQGGASADAHNYLGIALMETGRLPEALAQFRRAAALAPRDERIHFNVGNALSALSRRGEAVAAYARALAVNPDFADAHVNLAVLLFAGRRVEEALAHYRRAVDLEPGSPVIHNNLASALASLGRYKEALEHVQHALRLDPAYAPALQNLDRLRKLGIGR